MLTSPARRHEKEDITLSISVTGAAHRTTGHAYGHAHAPGHLKKQAPAPTPVPTPSPSPIPTPPASGVIVDIGNHPTPTSKPLTYDHLATHRPVCRPCKRDEAGASVQGMIDAWLWRELWKSSLTPTQQVLLAWEETLSLRNVRNSFNQAAAPTESTCSAL